MIASEPFLSRLRRSAQDPVLSGDSRAASQGRDAQFELCVAAIAARAGFIVEEPDPPSADWVLTLPVRRFALEAKRIKSFETLEGHVRKAAKQIARSSVGGVIVVDYSRAAMPSGNLLPHHVPDPMLDRAQQLRGEALMQRYRKPIRQWVASSPVGIVVMHDHIVRPAAMTSVGFVPWGLHGFWDALHLTEVDSARRRHFDEFWNLFGTALPNL